MCARIRSDGSVKPGSKTIIRKKKGLSLSTFGFDDQIYNSRWEGINTTWRRLQANRAILTTDSFWEGHKPYPVNIIRSDLKPFNLACICNDQDEFLVCTIASNEVIKPYHHRQALCLSDDQLESYLNGNFDIIPLNTNLFKINLKLKLAA